MAVINWGLPEGSGTLDLCDVDVDNTCNTSWCHVLSRYAALNVLMDVNRAYLKMLIRDQWSCTSNQTLNRMIIRPHFTLFVIFIFCLYSGLKHEMLSESPSQLALAPLFHASSPSSRKPRPSCRRKRLGPRSLACNMRLGQLSWRIYCIQSIEVTKPLNWHIATTNIFLRHIDMYIYINIYIFYLHLCSDASFAGETKCIRTHL